MQLETKHRWKSKTLSSVTPPGITAIALAAVVGLNAGCSSSAQLKAPAPPEVSVAEVVCKQIGDSDEFTGRLEAVNAVEVRPRVSGYLQSVHFKEGAIVRQGNLLFQIDARPFQAEVDRLKGDLSQAKAQRSRAQAISSVPNDFTTMMGCQPKRTTGAPQSATKPKPASRPRRQPFVARN